MRRCDRTLPFPFPPSSLPSFFPPPVIAKSEITRGMRRGVLLWRSTLTLAGRRWPGAREPANLVEPLSVAGGGTPHVPSADRGSSVPSVGGGLHRSGGRAGWLGVPTSPCFEAWARARGGIVDGQWGWGGGRDPPSFMRACVWGHVLGELGETRRAGTDAGLPACLGVCKHSGREADARPVCSNKQNKKQIDQPPKRDPCSLGSLPRPRSPKA